MATTISGTTGVTYPAGGTDNVAGAGVGTTDTQTLTNKTLTTPSMTSPTISSGVLTFPDATTQSSAATATRIPVWTYFTSSGTYTVPTGVTSIRGYAGGAGGNGATGSSVGGGAGGGFAFGNIAVTAGQTVTVTISSGVATLAIGATTYLTGNPGGNASGTAGGTGGTASIHASVTSGGAYSGGAGGNATAGGKAGGGSCGSPLEIGRAHV